MLYKKVLLLILDGFGENDSSYGNAIAAAQMPFYDKFKQDHPHAQLIASGKQVGLPDKVMGNSEVGHLNIGSGRIIMQQNCRIDDAIEKEIFYTNHTLNDAVIHAVENNSALHIFGLLSDGNVHSNMAHIYPILEMAQKKELQRVYIHAFMDGRDTLPDSGINYINEFQQKITEIGCGKIATVSGRYYAMDRDKNWDRTALVYDALVRGKGILADSPQQAVEQSYKRNEFDEFIKPTVITDNGKPLATVSNNDAVIFINYRADRARQITQSLIFPDFSLFPAASIKNLHFVSFSEYDEKFNNFLHVAFPPQNYNNTLAEVISNKGLKQLHLAETEKYAHVTFFFNGGEEKEFPGEQRIMIPSPKEVKTYDEKPQMSAPLVKNALLQALKDGEFHFIVTNFANPDMVGHTGDMKATIAALEVVDSCLSEVIPTALENDYNIILIADHGNADAMLDPSGAVLTQHSTNPVPIIVAAQNIDNYRVNSGILADVAPTVLSLMQIKIPREMTGKVLITTDDQQARQVT